MKAIALVLLSCLVLAGCGRQTPLSHAISAFRAGDRLEFMKAQAEADEAVKTALQPGDDLCKMSAADIAKHSAVHMLQDMDKPDILARPEEERLIFVLSIAGEHSKIWPGSFLLNAPMVKGVSGDSDAMHSCGTNGEAMTAMREGAGYMQTDDEARMNALDGWIKALKAKHGDRFDAEMQAAAGRLSFAGYPAPWPPKVDFGEYATMPTFESVRDQLK